MGQIKNIKLHIVTDIKSFAVPPINKMAVVDTNEEFWGITLTAESREHTWKSEDPCQDIEHKIQVTQACLGVKAKEGERNILEVSTEDDDGKKMSCAVVSLRVGATECMHLELGFTNPVKFTLKEGNGPISLCGVLLSALPLDFGNEGEEEESSDEEDVPQLVDSGMDEDSALEVVETKKEVKVETKKVVTEEKKEAVMEERREIPEEK